MQKQEKVFPKDIFLSERRPIHFSAQFKAKECPISTA
jgi:hypothetical protein